jgi:hypothetical protein
MICRLRSNASGEVGRLGVSFVAGMAGRGVGRLY